MMASMAMASMYMMDYRFRNDWKESPTRVKGNGFSKETPKPVDSRQLREFSIKGHKVMAYSKKDAITRLKHQKKI